MPLRWWRPRVVSKSCVKLRRACTHVNDIFRESQCHQQDATGPSVGSQVSCCSSKITLKDICRDQLRDIASRIMRNKALRNPVRQNTSKEENSDTTSDRIHSINLVALVVLRWN